MELIDSEGEKTEIPAREQTPAAAEAGPRPAERGGYSGGIGWLRPLALLIIAVALIVGLVFLARWIYHASHNKPRNTSGLSTAGQQTARRPSGSAGQKSSNKSSKSSGPGSSASSSAAGTVPNTGPGNVAAVFAASAIAAAGLHYVIRLRRQN